MDSGDIYGLTTGPNGEAHVGPFPILCRALRSKQTKSERNGWYASYQTQPIMYSHIYTSVSTPLS